MALATFPLNIFTTQRMFNDYGADDMRYGDICERRMKNEFGLTHISNVPSIIPSRALLVLMRNLAKSFHRWSAPGCCLLRCKPRHYLSRLLARNVS